MDDQDYDVQGSPSFARNRRGANGLHAAVYRIVPSLVVCKTFSVLFEYLSELLVRIASALIDFRTYSVQLYKVIYGQSLPAALLCCSLDSFSAWPAALLTERVSCVCAAGAYSQKKAV
jgi:hypothetical protein